MQESAFALFLHACYARNFKNKQTKIKNYNHYFIFGSAGLVKIIY